MLICKILSLEAFIIQILPAEFIARKMLLYYDLTNMTVCSINFYA